VKPDNWQRATALASILSVLVVGVGLVVTNNYNRAQQELALQGQITDRFNKTVEQLGQAGPQKIDVRLGAIYALQRIMRDSANDQPAVVAVLSAFVRVHVPIPRFVNDGLSEDPPTVLAVDIQAALTVLARRDASRDGEDRINLSLTRLGNADVSGADLHGASLFETKLRRADLSDVNLSDAKLIHADLSIAGLEKANLRHAVLIYADLRDANLSGADLRGADLRGAILSGADFSGADLRGALVSEAEGGADLDSPQFLCTVIDKHTMLPAKVVRPILRDRDADLSQCEPSD
jgi:uncharacterized protein YjbI with pentapeptide repeats